jgi:hypothetical protein
MFVLRIQHMQRRLEMKIPNHLDLLNHRYHHPFLPLEDLL